MPSRRTRLMSRPEGGLRRRRASPPRREREQPADPPPPGAPRDHFDERRWREAGGPEDRALYTCSCGYAWEASVSASVSCPHCGAAQAW